MLVVLPSDPRRAWLRAFWVAMSLWASLVVGLFTPLDPWGRAAAALMTLAAGAAGILRPTEVRLAYRVWNKAAQGYARVAQASLLALCYGVVTVVGAAGCSLRLRRPGPGESLWYSRSTLPSEAYGSQYERADGVRLGRPWAGLFAWALRTGNAWVIFLLPFLMLIAALDRSEGTQVPAGIYTLF